MSPEQHPLHWTDDADLLSAFVLGRIGEETGRALERHLETCPRCASAVQAERLLAAGAKRLGRERLKEELGRRLDSSRKPVPWTPILSAAAILAVALGLAYLNRWIELADDGVPPDALITEQDAPPAGTSVAPANPPAPMGRTGEKAAGPEERRARSGSPEQQDEVKEMENLSAGKNSGKAEKAEAVPPRFTDASAGEEDEGGEWWSGRQVILGGPGDSLMLDVNPGAARGEAGEVAVSAAPRPAGKFVVRQMPVSALPGREKAGSRAEGKSGLRIRVDRSGETIILTIFADPPFDPSLLSCATVEEAGTDSLLITIGGETFGVSPVRPGKREK